MEEKINKIKIEGWHEAYGFADALKNYPQLKKRRKGPEKKHLSVQAES